MLSKSKRRLLDRLRRPRQRRRESLVLAEGPRVVREALRSPAEVLWVVLGDGYVETPPGRRLFEAAGEGGADLHILPTDDVLALCTTETPRPVLAVVREPPCPPARDLPAGGYLYLDAVQDPGNVGTLIRSAWAFGLSGAVVAPGSADPWSHKAVRASAGAVFHVPLFGVESPGTVGIQGGSSLLYAEAGREPAEDDEPSPKGSWVLAVGNEGSGVSSEVRSLGRPVSVAMQPGVDSLNVAVAGSILMYVLTRPHGQPSAASSTRSP